MEARLNVGVGGTPDRRPSVPDGTPVQIEEALRVAASTRFCRFLTDLERTDSKEFSIEALIGPSRKPVADGQVSWYRVRFLIPQDFPYRAAETVPVDPELKWYQHQNGDWAEDHHANILCPPRLNEIHLDELLLPYIRNAHGWISHALAGDLIRNEERYEFPHIVNVSHRPEAIYVEGGTGLLAWVQRAGYGRAWLNRRRTNGERAGIFVVRELWRHGGELGTDRIIANLQDNAFGLEASAGWVPWVFAGDPVVNKPHQPLVGWQDIPDALQGRILAAIREVCGYRKSVPLLLLAFAVPETWGGLPDRVVWRAIELAELDRSAFTDSPRGFRRSSDMRHWPRVRLFTAANEQLRWIKGTVDVSEEAMSSRAASETTSMSGLRVAILGAGAVGSILAKAFARLGPGQLVLIDKESIEPGNLVRHECLAVQAGMPKAKALVSLLAPIHAAQSVQGLDVDIVQKWDKVAEAVADCGIVVDATADPAVNALLSHRAELANKSVAWCYVKPGPEFGVLVLRRPGSELTLLEAEKRLMDDLDVGTGRRLEESQSRADLVWPEPGCYSPTFPAPYHRLRMMADAFVETILAWFDSSGSGDIVTLYCQDREAGVLGINNRIVHQLDMTG
jgi:hypothetical protein